MLQKKTAGARPSCTIAERALHGEAVTVPGILSPSPAHFCNRAKASFGGPPFHRKIRGLSPCPAANHENRTSTLDKTTVRDGDEIVKKKGRGSSVPECGDELVGVKKDFQSMGDMRDHDVSMEHGLGCGTFRLNSAY